jgi:preprotein translocase subunit SecB
LSAIALPVPVMLATGSNLPGQGVADAAWADAVESEPDMAQEPNGNGADNTPKQAQINVLGQYIKDFSFENPRAPESLRGPGGNPSLHVNFNVQAQSVGPEVYEVLLSLDVEAKSDEGPLYTLELVYAGGFRLRGIPQQALKPILFIECPALLFPFVRRIVLDTTREGGFPPLPLDPIDFAALYRQRTAQEQGATASA